MGLIYAWIFSGLLSANAQYSGATSVPMDGTTNASPDLTAFKKLSPNTGEVCSLSDLSKDCRIFDALPDIIQLPDGSSFPNPKKANANFGMGMRGYTPLQGCPAVPNETQDQYLDRQAALVEQMATEKGLSTRASIALQNSFLYMGTFSLDENGKFVIKKTAGYTYPANFLSLPWPADKPNSQLSPVPLQEVAQFLNGLSPETRKALDSCIKVVRDQAAMNENLKKQWKDRQVHLEELVEEAKKAIIEKLEGNPPSNSDPNVENLIEKLDSIKLADISKVEGTCRKDPNNAYYDPDHNDFHICYGITSYPDSQLIGIIGHELFHSIDPCLSTAGVWQIPNNGLIKSFVNNPSPTMTTYDSINLQRISENPSFALDPSMNFSEAFNKEASRLRLWKQSIPGVPIDKYPMHAALQCLQTQAPLAKITDQDLKETAKQYVTDNHLPQKDEDLVFSALKRNPNCVGSDKQASQTTEAMADMGGAVAQARYLKKHPPQSDLERLGALSFFINNSCKDYFMRTHHLTANEAPTTIYQDVQMLASSKQDPHPDSALRTEKIYMSQPDIAAALGCKPQDAKDCFTKLDLSHQNSGNNKSKINGGQE